MANTFTLSDNSISHIAQLVQIAILTGTDIIDHMRMVNFESDEEGKLVLNEEYSNRFNETINNMLSSANNNFNAEVQSE